jgi:nitronate monooxygenase
MKKLYTILGIFYLIDKGGNKMSEKQQLIDLLNALLEAERAGVATANHLLKDHPFEELDALYEQLKKDESWSCAGLHQAILHEGGKPSMKTGDFIEKVHALETLTEKLFLLNKGQAWVARKIDVALGYGIQPETETFLKEMKDKHYKNIGEMEKFMLGQ